MRVTASDALELVGLSLLLVAAAALDWRALLAVVGVVLLAAGYLVGSPESGDSE